MSNKNEDRFGDVLPVEPASGFEIAIANLKEQWPKWQEYSELRAKYNKALYESMLKTGFNEAQAFSFVMAKGI